MIKINWTVDTDREVMFNDTLGACELMEEFQGENALTTQEREVLRLAFDGIFKKRGKGFRKNHLPHCGFVRRDGTVDKNPLDQCLQSSFGKLFLFHTGKGGGYLGTALNADFELSSYPRYYGLCESLPRRSSILMDDGPEKTELQEKEKRVNTYSRKFSQKVDTFIQVFIFLGSGGKTTSRAGDRWRKAIYG